MCGDPELKTPSKPRFNPPRLTSFGGFFVLYGVDGTMACHLAVTQASVPDMAGSNPVHSTKLFMPDWWNWQTHWIQNPARETSMRVRVSRSAPSYFATLFVRPPEKRGFRYKVVQRPSGGTADTGRLRTCCSQERGGSNPFLGTRGSVAELEYAYVSETYILWVQVPPGPPSFTTRLWWNFGRHLGLRSQEEKSCPGSSPGSRTKIFGSVAEWFKAQVC